MKKRKKKGTRKQWKSPIKVTERMKKYLIHNTLNPNLEKTMLFPIKEGELLEIMDLVMVDMNTCEAELAKKKENCFSVGRAVTFVKSQGGIPMVICKDGILSADNTREKSYRVQPKDEGSYCYYDNNQCVTMNSKNTSPAGVVMAVIEGRVYYKIYTEKEAGYDY